MAQGVLLFPSVHFVIQAEKLIKSRGFPIKVIPVPRELSSDCGVCLRINWEEREKITTLLNQAGVKIEGMHLLGGEPK
ncbi:MAG: DUF3343 domain-containing protein [Syntrophaceae bacterium]|nr:DUF3343 domain-containing protein [Syntrophaceae bacterium]